MTLFGKSTSALAVVDVASTNFKDFLHNDPYYQYELIESEIDAHADRLQFYNMLDHLLDHFTLDGDKELCIEMDCVYDEYTDTIHKVQATTSSDGEASIDISETSEENPVPIDVYNRRYYSFQSIFLRDLWDILFGDHYGAIRIDMYIMRGNGEITNLYSMGDI